MRYGGYTLEKLPLTTENIKQLYCKFDKLLSDYIVLRNNNFCHADIKPQNILFNSELNKYNLIDFGWSFCSRYSDDAHDPLLCAPEGTVGYRNQAIDSTFIVIAHTSFDEIFFTSDPASGYSVDNLAPTIPQQFSAGNNGVDQVILSWEYETEEDFSHHEFNSLWNNTQSVTDSFYVSSFTEAYDEYYLHSIDVNGNISDASPITSVHRFSQGANLVSFNSLPNQTAPSTILGDISYGIIGEGVAASNIDGTWVGSLTNVNQCDGYWVFADNDAIHTVTGTNSNCVHALNEGSNLKGYPCEYEVQVSNAV